MSCGDNFIFSIDCYIKKIKNNLTFLIIGGSLYVVGIILGIFFLGKDNISHLFFENVYNYFFKIFDPYSSPVSTSFIMLLTCIGYTVVFFGLSFTFFTYPLQFIIIIYRGVIIGGIARYFITCFGINGFVLYFFVTLPQNLIITAGLLLSSVLNFDHVTNLCDNKPNIKVMLFNSLLGLAVCFTAIIYGLLVVVVIVRPMNIYF